MGRKKNVVIGVVIGLLVFTSIFSVNAGVFSSIFRFGKEKADLSGELDSTHHANLTITSEPPIICNILPYSSALVEGLHEYLGTGSPFTSLTAFNISVYHPNGAAINLPGADDALTAGGYVYRNTNTPRGYPDDLHTKRPFIGTDCKFVYLNSTGGNDCGHLNQPTAIYTCNASMYYYDDADPYRWGVNVTIFKDKRGSDLDPLQPSYAKQNIFALSELQGLTTDQSTIQFGQVSPTLSKAIESASPIILINTGNSKLDGTNAQKNITFMGSNLTSELSSYAIPADNFNAHLTQTLLEGACNGTAGGQNITLKNSVKVAFPQNVLVLNNGDQSSGNDAKFSISFCLKSLPSSLPEGRYSTQNGLSPSPWTIGLG
jgi:hypothetical protein